MLLKLKKKYIIISLILGMFCIYYQSSYFYHLTNVYYMTKVGIFITENEVNIEDVKKHFNLKQYLNEKDKIVDFDNKILYSLYNFNFKRFYYDLKNPKKLPQLSTRRKQIQLEMNILLSKEKIIIEDIIYIKNDLNIG